MLTRTPYRCCRVFPRPYLQDVQYIAKAITEGLTTPAGAQNVRGEVTLLDIRMPEGGTIADDVLGKQLKLLIRHLQRGRIVYIHGWGGHGRNGIVTALLLHQLYGLGKRAVMPHPNPPDGHLVTSWCPAHLPSAICHMPPSALLLQSEPVLWRASTRTPDHAHAHARTHART